ncbi:unnamed protein product [Ostreobium quekettii]|uniref:Uncharacterized protein n=1 Tax=Ostreobium quekettii TaxID=121088 RepID=A0A8S1IWE0_9CHLO|nr:unnamed protein product [Ostreobium quekettii]
MARGRFAPNAFQHNGRVALALVPSLIVLGGIGGRLVVGMLLVGAMVTYIMDALRLREAAFASVWFTLVVANIGFLTGIRGLMKGRSAALTVGIIGMMGVTLMLHGIWATVQFKWIQMRYPMVVLAMERLLLSSSLVLGLVVQGFGAAGAVGIDTAPFYMAALGCVLYALCMLPLPSSFEKKV